MSGKALLWLVTFMVMTTGAAASLTNEVTIHELKQNWRHYDGKKVQLRGQLDRCVGTWRCNICPEEMTRQSYNWNLCIPVSFGHQHKQNTDFLDEQTDYLMQRLYRFATVTIEAKFSALCLWDEKGNQVGGVICTDGPANLDEARILQVHSRKTAQDGLIDPDEVKGLLKPAVGADREEMFREFQSVVWYGHEMEMFKVQLNEGDIQNKKRGDQHIVDGVGCVCLAESCEGQWPREAYFGMNSPANPFICWLMQKKERGWRLIPEPLF
jgi:hypothetical protein